MARNASTVTLAGQSITTGKNWGIFTQYVGDALSAIPGNGFDIWKYFKADDGFGAFSKIHLFKDESDNVLFAIGYSKPHLNNVYLFYLFATQDGQGNITYLSPSITLNDMLMAGKWDNNDYVFDAETESTEDAYRATLFFFTWDVEKSALECSTRSQPIDTSFDGTISIFNGFSSASLGTVVENKWYVMANEGQIENNIFVPIPPPFSDEYTDPRHVNNIKLPMAILTGTTEAEVLTSFEDDTDDSGGGIAGEYGYGGADLDFPDLPTKSAADCGMLTLYDIEKGQMLNLSAFLWSSDFFDNIIKLFSDPMDAIIMCGIVPMNLSSLHDSYMPVYVGNTNSGAFGYKLSSQYMQKDFGSLYVPLNWDTALDYEPFTKAAGLYLPFIGVVPISLNEIMGSYVHLKYNIDLLTGDCVATVKIQKNVNHKNYFNACVYHHRGNLLSTIQLSGKNYSNFYSNMLNTVLSMGSSVASPMAGIKNGIQGAMNTVLSAPEVQKTGSFSGSSALLMTKRPYIMIGRPNQQFPSNYGNFVGFPTYRTMKLSTLEDPQKGPQFVQCEDIIDSAVSATDTEKEMIEKALKEGVYL